MISKRRLLYLWNILQRDDKELLKRFYLAQQVVKTKNDWAEIVESDKSEMNINLSDDDIAKMKESRYKSIVEKAVTAKALEHLNNTADNHSKSQILIKPKLEREKYFDDQRFSRSEVELLFALRTRMTDLKGNFSNKYGDDIACRICKVHIERQEHLLKCEVLKSKVENPKDVVYEDIFGHVDKQLEAVRMYKKLFREREVFLNT